ncbi:MAG: hypothetical protein HKN94_16075 [Acidimicrobiales bacterium]|nr:hypothetical protein [Acidimicrobiales bacterium]RZV46557.1 MAG: hypothetical protein EX269_06985 [Acidimicrobiales bacterium]
MTELHLEFIDELTVATPDDPVSFGRQADVVVDEANQYMHRVIGTFFHQDNNWWLVNKSKRGHLTLIAANGSHSSLAPDAISGLTDTRGTVRFEAGPSTYELEWSRPDPSALAAPGDEPAEDLTQEMTTQFGVVMLNVEQRQLLAALSERHLTDSMATASDLPSNAAVAHRLGWTLKKLDRKLDYLCARLDREGVRGLRGGKGIEAVERRARLVEHVISSGMIGQRDLEELPSS